MASLNAEEYVAMSFDGVDREYVDGEIVERAMPNAVHGALQALLAYHLVGLAKRFGLRVMTECRHELQPGSLYRVSDVAMSAAVRDMPPLLVAEIASPGDTVTHTLQKLADYERFGVPHIWFIDPESSALYVFRDRNLVSVQSLTLPEFEFALTKKDLDLPG
jgi:Uma2 family endonuclease